jgi:hypothetical protein
MTKGTGKGRGGFRGNERWSPEQDADLIRLMAPDCHPPYSTLRDLMNEMWPGMNWSRNAILGRANRLGLRSKNKPHGYVGMRRKSKGYVKKALVVPRQGNIEFQPKAVRDDRDHRVLMARIGEKKRGRPSKQEIELRRLGSMPDIIDATPTTSKPMLECGDNDCKWPTSDDISSMEVCGQPSTFGAYCDKHGSVAYRLGPTRKRQAIFNKPQNEHAQRLPRYGHYADDEMTSPPLLLEFDDVGN